MANNILQHTQNIIGCRTCLTDRNTFLNGQSVIPLTGWAPPRGWAGPLNSTVDIVLVSLNPGAPLPGEVAHYEQNEIEYANVNVSATQATVVRDYCQKQYSKPQRGHNWTFHRKSLGYARALLWLLDGKDPGETPWERCWFTDLFKCSTKRESGPQITSQAFSACLPHLVEEVRLLRPKLIVALGGRSAKALRLLSTQQPAFSSLVAFRHPSNGCPRLEAEYHDDSFKNAARVLDRTIPANFTQIRSTIHEATMRI
jgi:hypothetical protein